MKMGLKLAAGSHSESASVERRERLFVERYPTLYKWALQFSAGDRDVADDLVQDAFLHFTTCSIDVETLRSVDKYLYVVLRNLFRSRLAAAERARCCSLDFLEGSSLPTALRAACTIEDRRQVLDDLRSVIGWLCSRKESTSMASALILKFFHGFPVQETAAIMATTRAAVDERLRVARQEARAYLADPGKVVVLDGSQPLTGEAIPTFDSDEDLRRALIQRIFASCQGECLEPAAMQELYGEPHRGIPVKRLAHIVSCARCLDLACRITGSSPPPEEESRQTSNSYTSARGKPPLERWRQNRSSLLSEVPLRLSVAVNGRILGTQAVAPGRNEFTVYLPFALPLDFIEVFNESGKRILFYPVLELPPGGRSVHRASFLGESGRRLDLELDLEGPWPAVAVTWEDPCSAPAPVLQPERESSMFQIARPRRRWAWPTLSTATAGLLVVLLVLDLARPSRVSAAQVLFEASQWESSTASGQEVLYRRYRLTSRSDTVTEPRTLSVWRHVATRERRLELADRSGKVIARATWQGQVPTPTSENLWQFEPAADVFQALAQKDEPISVSSGQSEIRLETSTVDLIVDRGTHRPMALTIRRGGEETRVSEISHEALPAPSSGAVVQPPRPIAPAIPRHTPKQEQQPGPSLDEVELAVRRLLMRRGLTTSAAIRIGEDIVEVELPHAVTPEVESELRSLGPVTLAQVDPAAAVAQAVPLSSIQGDSGTSPKRDPLLKGEMLARFGTIEAAGEWTSELHELEREIESLTGALVDLGRRFPANVEPSISPQARSGITQMVNEAESRLRGAANRLMLRSGDLDALRAALSAEAEATALAPGWRERAVQLSALAWQIRSASMHLLTGVQSDGLPVNAETAMRSFASGCLALQRVEPGYAYNR